MGPYARAASARASKNAVATVNQNTERAVPIAVVEEHVVPHYPSASLQILPNKGHLLPIEAPQEVATLIATFVASLPQGVMVPATKH